MNSFVEKPHGDGMFINGGLFVLCPNVIDLIEDDGTIWERKLLEILATLVGSKHISIMAFGSRWIPCEINRISKNYGQAVKLLGRLGHKHEGGWAYGFDDEEWVEAMSYLLRPHFESVNSENLGTIKAFYEYCEENISGEKEM